MNILPDTWYLYYWPGIPGRGEFVRLPLILSGASWVDVCRLDEEAGCGVVALRDILEGKAGCGIQPFAPPIIRHNDVWIFQTPAICSTLVRSCHSTAELIQPDAIP